MCNSILKKNFVFQSAFLSYKPLTFYFIMKIDIVIAYMQRYQTGHEMDFVPPITGIHLAAITPAYHEVRVVHQQVEPVNIDTDADLVAVSFFSGFAPEAYRLAQAYRSRGKTVVAGGPHVS